jgi:16S rRNA (cytidine1402-2'-O)-methyltransferase
MASDKRPGKSKAKKVVATAVEATDETFEEVSEAAKSGTLYVVATPIGNSLDWTTRARNILSTSDLVAAEDTRLLKREMAKVKIQPKKVISHHEHNEEASTKGLIETLLSGQSVALASDAGTPMVSDPGYRLLEEAIKNKIRIVPVPGPSSLTAALSVSALGGRTLFFGGFLPVQGESRKRSLRQCRRSADKLVFLEAPHRLREMLSDAEEIFGPATMTVVCRELTKPYEEIKMDSLSEVRKYFQVNEPRGEFVVLFKGAPSEFLDAKETEREAHTLLGFGRSASDILEELQPFTVLTRKQLYDIINKVKKEI